MSSSTIQHWIEAFPVLMRGAAVTVELTAAGLALASILALITALMRVSRVRVLESIAYLYALVIRGTPLFVQIFIVYFVINAPSRFMSGFIALGINYGAYMSEIVRGAIESIDKGQMEAARSVGMSYGLAMRRVIIPQTYKRLIPPLGNEFIAMLKDSALVSVMGLTELARAGSTFVMRTFELSVYFEVALVYLALTSIFSVVAFYGERWAGVHER
ncbi:MAG: amino acid ABC transporter permease [Symbiobacteriia bacterium]